MEATDGWFIETIPDVDAAPARSRKASRRKTPAEVFLAQGKRLEREIADLEKQLKRKYQLMEGFDAFGRVVRS